MVPCIRKQNTSKFLKKNNASIQRIFVFTLLVLIIKTYFKKSTTKYRIVIFGTLIISFTSCVFIQTSTI